LMTLKKKLGVSLNVAHKAYKLSKRKLML